MKTTLDSLMVKKTVLDKVFNTVTNAKLAYRVAKIAKKITSEFAHAEKGRVAIVEKLGEADPKGGHRVPPNKMEEFKKEYSEFLKEEVTLDIDKIPFELLQSVNLSVYDMITLEDFVEAPSESITDAKK